MCIWSLVTTPRSSNHSVISGIFGCKLADNFLVITRRFSCKRDHKTLITFLCAGNNFCCHQLVARSSRGTSNKSSRIFRTQTYLPSIGLLESVAPVTIDSHGNVGEIKVLERMGVFGDWPADVTALKTLIRWRANPGPIRTVDISWSITPCYRLITNGGSHLPRR